MKSHRDPDMVYQQIKDIGVQDISMEVIGSKEAMISEGEDCVMFVRRHHRSLH